MARIDEADVVDLVEVLPEETVAVIDLKALKATIQV